MPQTVKVSPRTEKNTDSNEECSQITRDEKAFDRHVYLGISLFGGATFDFAGLNYMKKAIKSYLKHVARDFDRKAMNPPRELAVNIPVDVPDEWIGIGYIPTPKTRVGWFTFHMIHGLAMRYPLRSVVAFSLLNTKYPDKIQELDKMRTTPAEAESE